MEPRAEAGPVVGTRSLNDRNRPARRFPTGRLCANPECGTRLSIYNDSDYCSLHREPSSTRLRGKTS